MTDPEAFEKISAINKPIEIEFVPKHWEMGQLRRYWIEARWSLRVWDPAMNGVKWDYDGKTFAACVELHMVHEQ